MVSFASNFNARCRSVGIFAPLRPERGDSIICNLSLQILLALVFALRGSVRRGDRRDRQDEDHALEQAQEYHDERAPEVLRKCLLLWQAVLHGDHAPSDPLHRHRHVPEGLGQLLVLGSSVPWILELLDHRAREHRDHQYVQAEHTDGLHTVADRHPQNCQRRAEFAELQDAENPEQPQGPQECQVHAPVLAASREQLDHWLHQRGQDREKVYEVHGCEEKLREAVARRHARREHVLRVLRVRHHRLEEPVLVEDAVPAEWRHGELAHVLDRED
mmetsp:Transcript_69561/g.197283  ORF Transcript_69561/g.197283 Transcript_69561/m.197283 type:complete len:274 (+) Transcript_69561:815-1636(+)